ncbi:RNA-guided endonuclease TnpB family protein [Hydrogenobacter hydrogenophilus]|uniref:Putative transposase n=1 Tax=Hydrogenobacter hydrogenophilus TaxID=35835 RepID=A0A285NV03_9AQUI|nr:RNA-guided endonuclease TnpB family protein [Hydrogenobacter hydrogenophilus]SNZ13322.1 putative transposase [Hydrogenobacter hydrogenophilus]
MLKAYRYRIYPNKEQEEFFAKTFGACRFVWNKMLEGKLNALNNKEKLPKITPAKYKKQYQFLREVDSLALANVQLNQEKAFRDYFKNKKHFGLPKFKKKKDKQSYTTNNQGNTIRIDFEKQLLYLPKVKTGIKIKLHRIFEGKIKSATITKTKSGNYYVSILVETDKVQNKIKQPKSKICGIDLGLKDFAIITNDNGSCKIENPKYLVRAEKRLKRLQRQLSRKQKGSNNYKKTREKIAKLHEYISNARNDFLHKTSKAIIDENQVIVVEGLSVKALQQSMLSKLVSDVSWGTFLRYLEYKANWYGRELIIVDRFYPSSKTCSVCGYINTQLRLSNRYWECPECNTFHDRDINASKNLYKVGLSRVGTTRTQACGECSDGGTMIYHRSTSQHSMKQEATTSVSGSSSLSSL